MLAIAGGKGGCGKTTTALGLARGFAALGSRPLVVDTDLDMPDLHHRAGVDRTPGLAAAAERHRPADAAQQSTRFPGIEALPAGDAESSTAGSVLDRLRHAPRPVLLDCPAGAGPDVAMPLRAAARSVLVSTPAEQSLRDAAKTAAMARHLDASTAAVTLVRSDGSVDPSPLLACTQVVHIPERPKPPLETEESASRYLKCAKTLSKRNV